MKEQQSTSFCLIFAASDFAEQKQHKLEDGFHTCFIQTATNVT